MRVGEALHLFASLHPSPRPIDELADEWRLGALMRRPFGGLSGGERQRLFVALALIGRPELVFLDELTQNLDPIGRRHTWDVVRRVRDRGTTVVLVTHDVEEAERLCDRIVVIDHGRVVADGTPAAIVDDARRYGRTCASPIPSSTSAACTGCRASSACRATVPRSTSPAAARCSPTSAPTSLRSVARRSTCDVERPSLEDRFVALTRGGSHDHDHHDPRPAGPTSDAAGRPAAPSPGSPSASCACWSASPACSSG